MTAARPLDRETGRRDSDSTGLTDEVVVEVVLECGLASVWISGIDKVEVVQTPTESRDRGGRLPFAAPPQPIHRFDARSGEGSGDRIR